MALGSDISGVLDIDSALSTVSGRRALAEAILRRLNTPRGNLPDDPTYGFDLKSIIGTSLRPSVIEQRVVAQVIAEEEVEDVRVRVTSSAAEEEIQIDIIVTDAEGEFEFTVLFSALTLDVILPEAL